MRIAIDGTESMVPKRTGTGVYSRSLIQALLAQDTKEELVILGMRGVDIDTSHIPPRALVLLRSPSYRTVWSQIRLPIHFSLHKYDLVHLLEQKLPRVCPAKSVVTVHDLAFMRFPEMFLPAHRARLAWFTEDAVRRAHHVIAISASTASDIVSFFHAPEAKITVIRHGIDHASYHEKVPPLKRNRPYILSVGALQPRKNYAMLFRAFARIRELVKEPIDLLIIGQRGWMWETIENEARSSPVSNDIHLLGFVQESEMPSYYAGAACVAIPSLYEGFGLPVIEAMACGAPVVTSNTSCFPEVGGDAAVFLDPADHNLWGETITELLRDTRRLKAMRMASLRQSTGFSWADAARQTMKVYQTLLNT